LFFGEHPQAVESGGLEETLAAIGPAQLKAFRKRLVVGGNVALAVSGSFDRAKLLPKLRRFLEKIPAGSVAPAAVPAGWSPGTGSSRVAQPRQQVVVYQAFPGAGMLDEDYYVSEVADELFSGMSSNLFERVREQRSLAYFVRSARVVGLRSGMFFFMAGTSPQQWPAVVEELDRELKRVRAGEIEEAELRRCQTRLKAARVMGMQTNGSCAYQAALNAIYGMPLNDWRRYPQRIDAITVADVQRFAQQRLRAKARLQLLVGAVK
jgi:zinc protease